MIMPPQIDPSERRAALRRARLHPIERRRARAAMAKAAGYPPRGRILLWPDLAMIDPKSGGSVFNFPAQRDKNGKWTAGAVIF